MFKLKSSYKPAGDQPKAIKNLISGIQKGFYDQTLLGVTGSGKTFVMANVIEQIQKPTLIISHNKTLAGQLFQEFREFFPENAVEYFVSYYDYYQPESYLPATDTYIEKDADINEEIDKLRLSTTTSLINRKDVIVVASVSSIYNIGSPDVYKNSVIRLKLGIRLRMNGLFKRLHSLYYERNDYDFKRGTYRVHGNIVDIFPAYEHFAVKVEFLGDRIDTLSYFDPVSGETLTNELINQLTNEDQAVNSPNKLTKAQEDFSKTTSKFSDEIKIYPAKHYIAPEDTYEKAIKEIQHDLQIRLKELNSQGKKLEAYRLEQKTNYDLEMMQEIGYCKGIENYSRYFDGRKPGEAPYSLLDYLFGGNRDDYLLIIDESHITIPQIRGMYNGDKSRKQTLIDYGFRLPSALDNRPLRFDEFERRMGITTYASATPAEWEINRSKQVVELIVRPTGLVDPKITILPTKGQIADLEKRISDRISKKERVLVTTLTKRMAEDLSEFLGDKGYKVAYLHSDVETLERSDILDNLRKGEYDVLVGINLLREGLDLPEVSLVAILDADKEGFLRSETSLIQTMGRAARHVQGEVAMYADKVTKSMKKAIDEVERRRKVQIEYNKKHNIKPQSITKPIRGRILEIDKKDDTVEFNVKDYEYRTMSSKKQKALIKELEKKMKKAAELLEFEIAAEYRDKIRELKKGTSIG